jgi:hypothetical protein
LLGEPSRYTADDDRGDPAHALVFHVASIELSVVIGPGFAGEDPPVLVFGTDPSARLPLSSFHRRRQRIGSRRPLSGGGSLRRIVVKGNHAGAVAGRRADSPRIRARHVPSAHKNDRLKTPRRASGSVRAVLWH